MQAQGFGRKGAPSGGAGYVPPRPVARPLAAPAPGPAQRADDPYADMRADFLAQERRNDAGASTLAWDTPTSGHSWYKSRTVAYLLWLFLGGFAAHRIYCARYISAALQVVLGLVAMITLIASPRDPSIWGWLFFLYGAWRFADLFLIPGMCRTPPDGY